MIQELKKTGDISSYLEPEVVVRESKIYSENLGKEFQNLQMTYDSQLFNKPPPEINFGIVEKDEPITNMDALLKQHLADRDQILKLALPPKLVIGQMIDQSIDSQNIDGLTMQSNKKNVSFGPTMDENIQFVKEETQTFTIQMYEDLRKEIADLRNEIRSLHDGKLNDGKLNDEIEI